MQAVPFYKGSHIVISRSGRVMARFRPLVSDAVVMAGALGFFGFLALSPAPGPSPGMSGYVTVPIVRGNLRAIVHATGTVEPMRLIEVSTELSGTLKRVLVKPNDIVRSGQLLAELDPASARAQLARSRASLSAAKARLKEANAGVRHASSDLERKRKLFANRYSSERDLDTAQHASARSAASAEMLTAEIEMAEADVRMAENSLAKTRIVSPVDGVVLRRSAEPGQTIASSLQPPALFRLAENLDEMQIKVDVDEADAMSVASGNVAVFSVHAVKNKKFPARVERINLGPEIVQGVVTYKAILIFDNRKLKLKPGMTATADIVVENVRGALLVPNAALRFPLMAAAAAAKSASPGSKPGLAVDIGRQPVAAGEFPAETDAAATDMRLLWVVEDGVSKEVRVQTGASDGTFTVVTRSSLKEQQRVAIDFTDSRR